jgi:competence protein ComEA
MATDVSSAPDPAGAPGDDSTPPGPSRGRAALASLRAAVEEPTPWSDRCVEALAAQVRARPATAVAVGVIVAVLVTGGAALVWSHQSGVAHPGSSATDQAQASVASTDGTDPTGSDPTGAGSTGSEPLAASAAGAGSTSELVVQVGGAVVRPGVYHLASGARVADLVARAGGLASDADGDRVDQAAALVDGTLIYVPRVGQTDLPDPVVGGGGGDSSSSDGSATSSAPVDLNTATATQLDTLPGVGPATAAAIVNYRRQHGPFRQIADLAEVTGIGPAKLAQIRPHVRV